MNRNQNDKKEFDTSNLMLFLYKWRYVLLVIAMVSIAASVIFSSPVFITPKYKSTVIMFPVSSNSISKALLSDQPGTTQDILEFGEDEQTEQMLQILNSSKIRGRIIEKYDLMDHYEIDPDARYKKTKLYNEYESNITFERTEYMAVEISVLDKDAELAARIANDIANLLDSTKNQMKKERATKGFEIVKDKYLNLKKEIREKEDSLTKLRQMGVHEYESQVEMLNQQYAIEIAEGNQRGIRALEKKLDILADYGGAYVSLRDALEHERKQLSELRERYEEAKADAEEVLPQKFVVDRAYKAEKKSYPKRWLIVIISLVGSLIIGSLVIVLVENFKRLNEAIKHHSKKSKFS
ncbi:MAG: hypothetical protein K9I94_00320 [Bacteroidales bacterium]|nr:hypothetical protein [Bacteroidales bacterium]